MRTQSTLLVLLMGAALASTGCQYATQTVSLNPTVQVSQLGLDTRQTVNLKVVDDRPEQGLGHRVGGYGQGAEIKLGSDIVTSVREAVTNGLERLNVGVAPTGASSPVDLTVTVRALKYVGSSGMFTFGSNVEGILQVAARRGDQTFEHRYTITPQEKRSAVVTTAEFNERLINEGLSDLLNQFLNDPAFVAFLRQ